MVVPATAYEPCTPICHRALRGTAIRTLGHLGSL
jgi:hypothetical protein